MKPKFGSVFLWAAIFNLVIYDFRDILLSSWEEIVREWTRSIGVALTFTSVIDFGLYSLFAYAILFYGKNWSIPKKAIFFIVSIFFTVGVRYLLEEVFLLYLLGSGNYFHPDRWYYYILDNLYYGMIFSGLGIAYYYIQYAQFEQKQRLSLQIQNQKTELAFLRSQINPHFLFNTLNNIYTLVYQKSDDSLVALDKLNTLLRYALYEQAERVLLQVELQYLNDFIDLQRLRYDYPINIEMKVDPSAHQVLIPPFLLIGFIENAFKHGDLKHNQVLQICFKNEDNYLLFTTKNKTGQYFKDEAGGIGLQNIQKRLELIYGNKHELTINQDTSYFEVRLRIPKNLPELHRVQ